MAESNRGATYWIGIAFVLGVVAFAWFTASEDREVGSRGAVEEARPSAPAASRPQTAAAPESPRGSPEVHQAVPAPPRTGAAPEPSALAAAPTDGGRAGGTADNRAASTTTADREASAPEQHASLDKEDVRSVIKQLSPQFRDCYQQGLAHDPKLGGGKVTVEFTLKRDVTMGSVPAEGSIADSTLGAPLVEACILDKLRAAKFPEMKGQGTVKVRYPFVFNNASADAGS